jgi:hypothetical protein
VFANAYRHALVIFFVLAFFFTWLYWLPSAAAARGWVAFHPPAGLDILAGYGPLLAALLAAALSGGRAALKGLAARLVRWRVEPRWYLAVLLLPILIQGGGLLIYSLLAAQPLRPAATRAPIPELLVFFPLLILGFDGLGEEMGWRGFALPRLLESRQPLAASLVLGLLWGLWHLPIALTPGSPLGATPWYLVLANTMGLAILHTWIFYHARASILIAILFHAWNNMLSIGLRSWFPETAAPLAYACALIVLWLLAIAVVLYLRPFRRAGRRRRRQSQARLHRAA